MKVRELLIHWGFEIDDKPLTQMEKNIDNLKSIALKTGLAIGAISASIGYLLNQSGKMEQWEIAFETMLGSADKAQELLSQIKDFAQKTPFELPGLIESSKQLLAFGFSQEKIIPTLKSLGDVAAGLGVPLDRLILNFGQVKAQTQLTGRELRDFAIAGVPILGELAKMLNKSESEIQNMVSSGNIGFDLVEKAFQKMTNEGGRFADLMYKQSASLFGIFSNIKDFLTQMAIDVGQKLLPRTKELSKQFLNYVEINKKFIQLKITNIIKILINYFEKVLNVIIALISSFKIFIHILGGLENAIKFVTMAMVTLLALNITNTLGSVIIAIVKTTTAIKALGWAGLWTNIKLALIPTLIGAAFIALGLIIEDIIAYFQGRKSITGAIVQMVQTSNSPLAKLARLFWLMIEPTIQFLEIIKDIVVWFANGGIQKAIDNICERLPWLSEAVNILASVFSAIMRPILLPFELLGKAIEFLVGTVFPKLGITFENFARTFGVILNPIAGLFNLIKSIFYLIQNLDFSKITTGIQKIAGTVLKPFEIGMNLLGIKTPKNNQSKDEVDSKSGFDFSGITKGIGSFVSSPKSSKFMSGFDNFATAGFGMPE